MGNPDRLAVMSEFQILDICLHQTQGILKDTGNILLRDRLLEIVKSMTAEGLRQMVTAACQKNDQAAFILSADLLGSFNAWQSVHIDIHKKYGIFMWGKICKQFLTAGVAGDGKIYIAGISKLLDQLPGMGKYLGHVIN